MPHRATQQVTISRDSGPGLDVVTIRREGLNEIYLTMRPQPGEDTASLCERFAAALRAQQAQVLKLTVFGDRAASPATREALERACGGIEWPITWMEGLPCGEGSIAGMQAHAVTRVPVLTLHFNERPVGRVFEDGHARHCILGDLRAEDTSATPAEQTQAMFALMESAVQDAGMDFTRIARTWLYLDRLLEWYGDLNRVRTAFFNERHLFDLLVPASTGIGASNSAGAAIIAEAIAVQSPDGSVTVQDVPSPLQCTARQYGSSFSRAIEMGLPGHRRLFISGTASIEPGGKSVHVGDMGRQVEMTMRVVEAILASRGMGWQDTTRAIAYIKHAKDAPVFERYCAENGLFGMPVVITECDVCREELLFEIELDAISTEPAPRG